MLASVPDLFADGISNRDKSIRKNGKSPIDMQKSIVGSFDVSGAEKPSPAILCGYLDFARTLPLDVAYTERIMERLFQMLSSELDMCKEYNKFQALTIGAGLEALSCHSLQFEKIGSKFWQPLCAISTTYGRMPLFLENLISCVRACNVDLSESVLDPLISTLVSNLATSHGPLRQVSLRLLDLLYERRYGQEVEILRTALTIENTPLDLQSARVASMHVRRLASQYQSICSDEWLSKAIPSFCFGLLTYKLAQLWDEAINAFKVICETKQGEDTVCTIAFQWLQHAHDDLEHPDVPGDNDSHNRGLDEFECSNLAKWDTVAEHSAWKVKEAEKQLQIRFDARHRVLGRAILNAPSQALRIFAAIPRIAENRSRQLVPLFLQWTCAEEEQDISRSIGEMGNEKNLLLPVQASIQSKLTRQDYKAMLRLFAFFNNPRVLFKSQEVFNAVLHLLANGDAEIQKAALGAISTWKLEGVQPYMEHLTNILDDARFREEISVFLQTDEQDSTIQPEHRAELMPVLLRILYGRVVARGGSTSRGGGQESKRKAVLAALSRLSNEYVQEFLYIALGPLRNLKVTTGPGDQVQSIEIATGPTLSTRKQMGLVTMIRDMLETLGGQLSFLTQPMINALLYCMCCVPSSQSETQDSLKSDHKAGSPESLLRVIRQVGLQCLNQMFKSFSAQSMRSYMSIIFSELLNPRLEKLPIETAQSISGTLRLISTWASDSTNVSNLVAYNPALVTTIADCLVVASAKEEVMLFVIDGILKPFITNASSWLLQEPVTVTSLGYILEQTGSFMKKSPSKHLLESAIQLMSMIVPLARGSSHIETLLDMSEFLLCQPSQRVSPKSKGGLLQIVQHLLPLLALDNGLTLRDRLYCTICSLFGYFKDRNNRSKLCEVLQIMAVQDLDIEIVASLCAELNSFSEDSVEEPNFERRLRAFNNINEVVFSSLSLRQWRPIVFNMLFFVKDTEELAIRSNASYTLRRFIEANPASHGLPSGCSSDLLEQVVLSSVRNGASEPSELVRAEYLSVMAYIVRYNPSWAEVNDLTPLLVDGDEEASFFNNVLHIQYHRRLRALRRLANEATLNHFRSPNIAHFLIPLIEHFIFDKADNENAHNLAATATETIGALADGLEWTQLRAVFRRYCSYIQSKLDLEKAVIKLIGVIIDAIGHAGISKQQSTISSSEKISNGADDAVSFPVGTHLCRLGLTMPKQDKLAEDITRNLLPCLMAYLHNKDESTVSLRVRVAVSVVKMLKLLPSEQLSQHLPPLLTDVCHILRSRAQESRDMTRTTLVEISTLIGPQCFGFILKELRSSLARGYQLHVLSYTIHSMMVATTSIFKPGDLDYCLPQIVAIIMDDIFGPTGQEKDAEEYVSKMKEVKSSKSFDTMELIAKTSTISHVSHLIRPLQTLLGEKVNHKIVNKIDELLRRIGVGLLRNEAIESRETLVFCFEILRETYKVDQFTEKKPSKEDYKTKRYLLTSNSTGGGRMQGTSMYNSKMARFSLDVLRAVLHKYDKLQTPSNLAGFMPAIGDALLQTQEEVQISALRLLSTIIKVPMKEIDDNSLTYVAEAVKIIKNTISTNTELAQASLKFMSAVLRERPRVEIRDADVAYLLKKLKPDLEKPDRQGVTFNFLRAVIARKMILPEVYEILDIVATIMVTNQNQGARDLARGVYFQFLLNYPQGKDRLSKQLGFLVKNLDYKHDEGRRSVMEAVHLLLTKLDGNLLQELVGTFFVPIVMVTVNDESVDCRKMAGVLLKELLEKANAEKTLDFVALLRAWVSQDSNSLLIRLSMQTYCTYLDVQHSQAQKEVPFLQDHIKQVLQDGIHRGIAADWETLYFALQIATKLCNIFPSILFRVDTSAFWALIRQCLYFPHAWVKLSAAKLLGIYFADFAQANADVDQPKSPLRGSGGLRLGQEEKMQVIKASLATLRVPGVGGELAAQSVKNLVFLARFMGTTSVMWKPSSQDADTYGSDEEDEDGEAGLETSPTGNNKTAIQYILERLSVIIRREPLTTKAPSLVPKTAALQLMAALCSHLPLSVLSESAEIVLLPLHNLTDPAIPAPYSTDEGFRTAYQALVSASHEIMSSLQKKMGTTDYIAKLSKVREGVKERREGRRVKRRLEAVAEPEKVGRDKRRKGEKKKEKRKERSGEERSRRRGW